MDIFGVGVEGGDMILSTIMIDNMNLQTEKNIFGVIIVYNTINTNILLT